ncbi:unnamed protein product, partial [Polarella glacialis]
AEMEREDEEFAKRLTEAPRHPLAEALRPLSSLPDKASSAPSACSFQCPLCLSEVGRDGAIELDCEHKMCLRCFQSYLESKIREAQVAHDELVCPMPGCRVEITVAQVEGAIAGTPLLEKFWQFRMNLWRPANNDDGIMVACPTPE